MQTPPAKITKLNENKEKIDNTPQSVVFVVDKHKVQIANVETAISDEGYIEIKTGLKEGEEIVIGSFSAISKELEDGNKIKKENDESRGRGERKR